MENIWKIIIYTKKFWKWYVFMGFFVVITSLFALVTPILTKQIVDIIVAKISGKPAQINMVYVYLGLILVTDIFITIFTSISTWVGDILAVRLQTHLTQKFYQHLLHLDISFYDNEITGQIVNKMYRGIESISDFVNNATNNFLPFFLTALVTIILLAHYSIIIAILLALLFPAYILISHKSTLAWNKHENAKNALNDASQGRVFESLSGIRVVKAFTAEIAELASYVASRGKVENITIQQTKEWHAYDFFRRFMLNIILFAIMSYIVYFTFLGRFTIGEMTLLLQLVQQARFPLFAMSFILGQIQMANAGSKDFFELLSKNIEIKDSFRSKPLIISKILKDDFINFKDVKFSYEHKRLVLNHVNFSIRQGEKLALVGESGQGKTTIVNLLLRFYEPDLGHITISGQDINKVNIKSLHSQIAVVFQESLLFSGTVFENIRYGRPDATFDEVRAAAHAANAHEFIEKFSDKYESLIGEHGVKLSGGQKQRISIARAILKNAPIIIMDEATSSLDSRSEVQVQIGLDSLMKNRTAIIIAHRLSTIADANHILVLSKGTVSQYGTPEELSLNEKGPYAHMVKLQNSLLNASPEEKAEALRKFDLVA
jgi:ATP-binding cassette, subfamily B, bacterial